jgi:RHS repeat-associated protein
MNQPLPYRPKFTSPNIGGYRYFFNGQEGDNEVFGEAALHSFEYRMHDARLGRFWSVDPLAAKYPWNSTYAFCENTPIWARELEGLEADVYLFDIQTNENDIVLVKASQNLPHIPNSFQVVGHGNPMGIRNVVDGKRAGRLENAKSFNNAFKNNEEWNKGKERPGFTLILYSCNTGRGSNSFAAKISSKYKNINVIAPTRQVWMKTNGEVEVRRRKDDGTRDENDPGYWLLYQNGKAVEAYDSLWQPGLSTKGHKVNLEDIPKDHYSGGISEKEFYKK